MNIQHIDIYAGENRTVTLYARDSNNVPVDLTGLTLSWSVARPPNMPSNLQAIFTYAGTVVDADLGSFTVPIAPADTSDLTPGDYFHQAKATSSAGVVQIVTVGRLKLRPLIGSLAA